MLKDFLHNNKSEIEKIAQSYGASDIRIFGSVARGEERPDSDIDILVKLPRGYDILAQRIPLAQELTSFTGRKIDLVPEHELSPYIKDYVIKDLMHL